MSQSRRPITRRTVLRGLGVAMGLPLLDAMRPVAALAGSEAAPVRMAFLFFPNGVNPNTWTPKGFGKGFELNPVMEPMKAVKDEVLVLTNLTNRATDTGDGHYVKDAAFLTGTTIRRTTGVDLNSGGISVDQVAARAFGNLTPLPSLELGVEPVTTGVDVIVGYTTCSMVRTSRGHRRRRRWRRRSTRSSPSTASSAPRPPAARPRPTTTRASSTSCGTTRSRSAAGSARTTGSSSMSISTRSAPSRPGSRSSRATAWRAIATTPRPARRSSGWAAASTPITPTPAGIASGRRTTPSTPG